MAAAGFGAERTAPDSVVGLRPRAMDTRSKIISLERAGALFRRPARKGAISSSPAAASTFCLLNTVESWHGLESEANT